MLFQVNALSTTETRKYVCNNFRCTFNILVYRNVKVGSHTFAIGFSQNSETTYTQIYLYTENLPAPICITFRAWAMSITDRNHTFENHNTFTRVHTFFFPALQTITTATTPTQLQGALHQFFVYV